MFLEKYEESAHIFWQGTQLHAKLQTGGSILTFQERTRSSIHVATGKPSQVEKLIRIFSEAATVTFRYCISAYITSLCV